MNRLLIPFTLALVLSAGIARAQQAHDLRDVQHDATNITQQIEPVLKEFSYEAALLIAFHKAEKELAQNPPQTGLDNAVAAIDDFNHRTERADQPPSRDLRRIADGARHILDEARSNPLPSELTPLRERLHHEWLMPLEQLLARNLAEVESIRAAYQFVDRALQRSAVEAILAVEAAAGDPKKP